MGRIAILKPYLHYIPDTAKDEIPITTRLTRIYNFLMYREVIRFRAIHLMNEYVRAIRTDRDGKRSRYAISKRRTRPPTREFCPVRLDVLNDDH